MHVPIKHFSLMHVQTSCQYSNQLVSKNSFKLAFHAVKSFCMYVRS